MNWDLYISSVTQGQITSILLMRQKGEKKIMGREWQQTRFKEFVMPDAVYYQSIWAVRDLERMEGRLVELRDEVEHGSFGGSIISEGKNDYTSIKPTEKKALEKAMLESRVDAINHALDIVPDRYRPYVIANVMLKKSGRDFPNKIWRIWKQRFLFNVAKNLSLI